MRLIHQAGCPSPTMCNCSPTMGPDEPEVAEPSRECDDNPYCQAVEPVTPPYGFSAPSFKIGDRVQVVLTALAPAFLKTALGKTGTVTCVVFCKSDGRTILYGVEYISPDELNGTGGRFVGYELASI